MLSGDYAAKLGAEGPQVLIIHTHGSESYTMPPGQEYDVSDTFRTLDTNCNMIRIGDEMAQVLTDAGISVVHDRLLYDYSELFGRLQPLARVDRKLLAKVPLDLVRARCAPRRGAGRERPAVQAAVRRR